MVSVVQYVSGAVCDVLVGNFLLLAFIWNLLKASLLLSFQFMLRPWGSLWVDCQPRTLWLIKDQVVVRGAHCSAFIECIQPLWTFVGYRGVG